MTKNLTSILFEKEILLESGTNEVEILVFRVGVYRLGINVAKVREILPAPHLTHLPKAHPSVVGCFQLRDVVVPTVSLHRHLEQSREDTAESVLILTEFNHSQTAFIVDEVERIHRISWEDIMPAPSIVTTGESPVTAVTNLENRLVALLDFETIAAEISQESSDETAVVNPLGICRDTIRVLVADDSTTVRRALEKTLRNSGYVHVTCFEHGRQAWDWIQKRFQETNDVTEIADVLISDVEMPAMDGLHLTRNIKTHPQLKALPVVLYSSILTPDNHKKGAAVGADAQLTKPELSRVVEVVDKIAMQGPASVLTVKTQQQAEPPVLAPC